MQAVSDIAYKLRDVAVHSYVSYTFIEMPQEFHSPGGHAVMHSGALSKLFYTVGFISGVLGKVRPIPVLQWKGQLSKQLTTKRINIKYKLKFNWRTKQNNIADAVAIGDWYLSRRKRA